MFSFITELLNSGDPVLMSWPMVNTTFWPFFLSGMYLTIVKIIGPAFMKNRKPFELQTILLCYNIFLVSAYCGSLYVVFDCIAQKGFPVLCEPLNAAPGKCQYGMAKSAWVLYMLKYVEYFDTIFFIMRKKYNLITNLHVIHHTVLPPLSWFFARTENSGYQAFPIIINSCIHVVMYSYYGLAAMGPRMRKYLWWKRYLTIAQMTQFVLIISVHLIKPFTGCSSSTAGQMCNTFFASLFLIMFMNFYRKTFLSKDKRTAVADVQNGKLKEDIAHENGTKKVN